MPSRDSAYIRRSLACLLLSLCACSMAEDEWDPVQAIPFLAGAPACLQSDLQSARIPPRTAVPRSTGKHLIQFRADADPRRLRHALNQVRSSRKRGPSSSFISVPAGDVEKIPAALIGRSQPDYIYRAASLPDDPDFNLQWALKNSGQSVNGSSGTAGIDVGAQIAWATRTDCSSVVVAIIDSGVNYLHDDLAANIRINPGEIPGNGIDDDGNGYIDDVRGWDFVSNDNDPADPFGHGTQVAGIIGAAGNNGVGITGVCWNASLLPLRILNESGVGTSANLIAAVNYAVAAGARVINFSLTSNQGADGDLVHQALSAARASGVLIITAAGNSGTDNDQVPVYPAGYSLDNIVSVTAIQADGAMPAFANHGSTTVHLGAPGSGIRTTYSLRKIFGYVDSFAAGLGDWGMIGNAGAWFTTKFTEADSRFCALSDPSGPGFPYAANWDTTMHRPFDLADADAVRVSFELRLDLEPGLDLFSFTMGTSDSPVSGTFYTNSGRQPAAGGWLSQFVHLPNSMLGASRELGIRLQTNGSEQKEGVFIRRLALEKFRTANDEFNLALGTSMAAPFVAGTAALLFAHSDANTLNCTYGKVRTALLTGGTNAAALNGRTSTGKMLSASGAFAALSCP